MKRPHSHPNVPTLHATLPRVSDTERQRVIDARNAERYAAWRMRVAQAAVTYASLHAQMLPQRYLKLR